MEKNTTGKFEINRRDLIAAALGAAVTVAGGEGVRRVIEKSSSTYEPFAEKVQLEYEELIAAKAAFRDLISRVDFGALGVEDERAQFADFITQADWEDMGPSEIQTVLTEQGVQFASYRYPDGSWKLGFYPVRPRSARLEDALPDDEADFSVTASGVNYSGQSVRVSEMGVELYASTPSAVKGEFYQPVEGSEAVVSANINRGMRQASGYSETIDIYEAPNGTQTRRFAREYDDPSQELVPNFYRVFSYRKSWGGPSLLSSDAIKGSPNELFLINP